MEQETIEKLKSFDLESIPDLDVVVLGALELFAETKLPTLDLSQYKRPLIVGSGNAEATGKIIFENKDAIFASESTYVDKLKNVENIDGVVLVSASGGKHAPIIAKCSKEFGKHVTLITNNVDAEADEYLDHEHSYDKYVFPHNREPYTYNTSTYMGMILGHTKENPAEIREFIANDIDTLALPDFSQYEKFYIIVPSEFAGMVRMLQVKFIELFGRRIARDVETVEYVKHATTVVPSNELFISFGYENTEWGELENRLNIPLPNKAGYAAMMAVSYYIIGKIQKAHPPYFKDNIVEYVKKASEAFGHEIKAIVE